MTTLRLGLCYRKSVCRLSTVTFVRRTQGVKIWEIFFTILYLSHPLASVQKFYGDRPKEIPPSGALSTRGVAK